MSRKYCKCGCGGKLQSGNWLVGHHMRRKSMKQELGHRAKHARKSIPKQRSIEWGLNIAFSQLGQNKRPRTEKENKSHRNMMLAKWKDEKFKLKMKHRFTNKVKRSISKSVKKLWEDKEYRTSQSKSHSFSTRELWRQKDFRLKMKSNCSKWKHGSIDTMKGGSVYYRSSWELFFIQLLESSTLIKSFKYEPFGIKYKFKGKDSYYYPDFSVRTLTNEVYIVEIKGWMCAKDEHKFKAARVYCKQKGYKFIVLKEKPLQDISVLLPIQ